MAPPAKRRKTSAGKADDETQATPSADLNKSQYPGFDPWNATLDIKGGDDDMPKFDAAKSQFMLSAKIYDTDAFKLKPLTIADGPLKGRNVLMLEPINDHLHFRFLDLPAEIRLIIYDMLLEEHEPIEISNFRSKYAIQRSVRYGFAYKSRHEGMTWDSRKSKWLNQTPSAHSLLRVSAQIANETAPIAYGSNRFRFDGLRELRTFLGDIGNMRRFLKHVSLDCSSYHGSLATPAFHKLKDAKNLRTLTFRHNVVCPLRDHARYYKPVTQQKLVADLGPLFKTLHKARKSTSNSTDVLDIIEILPDGYRRFCKTGKAGGECICAGHQSCAQSCREFLQHIQEIKSQIRSALADALGIQEI